MLDQGDEDAIFIQEFEDQIIEAVEESGDLDNCLLSYREGYVNVLARVGFGLLEHQEKEKD